MTRKSEGNTAQAAAGRLNARADWLVERAVRAGAGTNGRRKMAARATHLRACAALIVSDTDHGTKVRARLEEMNAYTLGWRGLAEWVTLLAGELFKGEKAPVA